MEIANINGTPTIRLVKYVKRDNFAMILYRIAKNLSWREHGTDLVQLTPKYLAMYIATLKTQYFLDLLFECKAFRFEI